MRAPDILARIAISATRLYRRTLSPAFSPRCRFVPSCSHYTEEALAAHGLWRGGAKAIGRLLRCHPFGDRGYDPP